MLQVLRLSIVAIAIFAAPSSLLADEGFFSVTVDGEPLLPFGGNPLLPPTADPSRYLDQIYGWFLAFVGISAMFAFVYGGVLYMFSGPNITKTELAFTWIRNGIYGLLLAALSILLLSTINPDLVGGFDLSRLIGVQ